MKIKISAVDVFPIIAISSWGSSWVITKILLWEINPINYTFLKNFFGFIPLLIIAVISAVIFLHENVTIFHIIGGGIVFVGIFVARSAKKGGVRE